jgi:hypothetical protein
VESDDASPPASISSRSSSSTPSPPASRTLPLTPPQTPPIPPLSRRRPREDSHVHLSIYGIERPEPFPIKAYATPKPNRKPRLSIETKSPHWAVAAAARAKQGFEGVSSLVTANARDIPPALAVRAVRPAVATAQAPLPSRASVASVASPSASPVTPSGQYTAMLDFRQPFNMPKKTSGDISQSQSLPAMPRLKPKSVIFSFPVARDSEANSPTRYIRRTSLVSPKEDGNVSPVGPVGSSIKVHTNTSPDLNYRGGYELDENNAPRGPTTTATDKLPEPSKSPKSRPTLPRISTDLSSIKPLNVQPVKRPGSKPVRLVDEGLTSADMQSSELADILNLYLDEIIDDARARGVMSASLEEYLRSPTIMGEWNNDLEIIYEDKPVGEGNVLRTVSVVRKSLHSE